jgi:excisionase family DNA binding protein
MELITEGKDMSEVAGNGKELLHVEEVASFLDVGPVTIYRWCREGRLPCLKIGRSWRIQREALEEFLRQSERSTSITGQLRSFLTVPDNLIAVAQTPDLLHRLDAAFFLVGEARGGMLVKFYGGQGISERELRTDLMRKGLEVDRLEKAGRLRFSAEKDPLEGREALLRELVEQQAEEGRTVWISFDWSKSVDLETALDQQAALMDLVYASRLVVKTAVLENAIETWAPATLRRAQATHSGTIWLSEAGLAMSRLVPVSSGREVDV